MASRAVSAILPMDAVARQDEIRGIVASFQSVPSDELSHNGIHGTLLILQELLQKDTDTSEMLEVPTLMEALTNDPRLQAAPRSLK